MTNFLTTVQYCAAITLITRVFIAKSQIDFIFQRELGIDKDGIVVIEARSTGLENKGNFKMLQFAEYLRTETRTVAALSANALGELPEVEEVRNVGSPVRFNFDSHRGVDEYFIPLHNMMVMNRLNQ